MKPLYSLVIPLKNEEENVDPLAREIIQVMRGEKEPFELIFVDDGSSDATLERLLQLKKEFFEIKIISFDKNYGQSSAFDGGFKEALGEWVITLDGDRQNDPEDIPKLLAFKGPYDLVCGIRTERKDPWMKRFISFFANRIRDRVCKDGVKDTGCSLKVYRKAALERIKLFHGMHRFLPALFVFEGFKIVQVEVRHHPRGAGKSHYTLWNRSLGTFLDLLAVYWMRKRYLRYKVKVKW